MGSVAAWAVAFALGVWASPRELDSQAIPGVDSNDAEVTLGRSLSFGYSLSGQKTLLAAAPGRFGLPEQRVMSLGDDWLLWSGPFEVRSGTAGWLSLDLDHFREHAGVRLPELSAIPGVKLSRPSLPVTGAVGALLGLTRGGDGPTAALLQLSTAW